MLQKYSMVLAIQGVLISTLYVGTAFGQLQSNGLRKQHDVAELEKFARDIQFVQVKGGEFSVRRNQELQDTTASTERQRVSIDDFELGKYEIMLVEFEAWCNWIKYYEFRTGETSILARRLLSHFELSPMVNRLEPRTNFQDYPATGMNHWAAKRYCLWLSIMSNRFCRLPTEAEWEYACRAGGSPEWDYPWGDDPSRLAEFAVVGGVEFNGIELYLCDKPGQRKPNSWGIYDMLGNVEEWVADGFDATRPCSQDPDWKSDVVIRNPVAWPVHQRFSWNRKKNENVNDLRNLMRTRGELFVNGYGVAKGGSGITSDVGPTQLLRSIDPKAFTVSARTNPLGREETSGTGGNDFQCDMYEMFDDVARAIGFRVCRPSKIPDRQTQLWHWGIYFEQDKWMDLTMEPSP